MGKYAKIHLFLVLTFSILSISGFKFIRPWTLDEENAASNLIREYQDAFQYFASVNHEGKGAIYMFKIQDFFNSQRSRHFYDLFDDYNPNSTDLEDYLFTIKNQYKCNLTVEFEPLGMPKQEIINGKNYARYILRKKISYQTKSKEVTNIIMVEMGSGQPKIDVIGLPEHFPDGGCISITKTADEYFNNQNFSKAKELYQARLLCAEDPYAREQLIACNNLINQQSQINDLKIKSEGLLSTKQYDEAQIVLENLIAIDPDNSFAKEKMLLVRENLSIEKNYQLFLTRAETLINQGQIAKALNAYKQAQSIKDEKSLGIKIKELQERMQQKNPEVLTAKADQLFSDGEYIEARSLYQEVFMQNPTKAIENKLSQCDNQIRFKLYTSQAQQYFQDYNYQKAREMVQMANQYLPNNTTNQNFLVAINQEIQFNKYLDLADYFMEEAKLFEQARQHYAKALEIHPGDIATQDKMKLAETLYKQQLNSPASVKSRVSRAVKLFNRKKYDQCFEILHQVVESDMLAPGHYYMLGEIAVTNRKNIHKKMGWNKKQGISIGAYYLSKAIGDRSSIYSIKALKRYCDLRYNTIQTLQLKSFD
ncbi:MAG: tetratricopeptide repeat protein, partial [Bacteroidota bacterium]